MDSKFTRRRFTQDDAAAAAAKLYDLRFSLLPPQGRRFSMRGRRAVCWCLKSVEGDLRRLKRPDIWLMFYSIGKDWRTSHCGIGPLKSASILAQASSNE